LRSDPCTIVKSGSRNITSDFASTCSHFPLALSFSIQEDNLSVTSCGYWRVSGTRHQPSLFTLFPCSSLTSVNFASPSPFNRRLKTECPVPLFNQSFVFAWCFVIYAPAFTWGVPPRPGWVLPIIYSIQPKPTVT
jgi:hypothetical protein